MEIPGYRIQREIGRGGMAIAYLATQESLEREVVLKVLNILHSDTSENLIERFLAEGRIVATLNHPNIITIYDIGIADDALYISMEYVDGGDLKSRIVESIDPADALYYLSKIGSALEAAHRQGIVHRDIKPANILFKDDETLLLTDFGIAKQVNLDQDLTSTGMFIGSPNYVSPEQADGSEIDGRADIYSLGCMFYEMLTGKKPYRSNTVIDIVIQHKQSPIPELPKDLKKFQSLLNKMMAKDQNDRFENAAIMNGYIENLMNKLNMVHIADISTSDEADSQKKQKPSSKTLPVLMIFLFISAAIFGALNYLEIRIKNSGVRLDSVPITSTLTNETNGLAGPEPIDSHSDNSLDNLDSKKVVSKDVINALTWLGKQSLEEYRLTHPPKDNAFYYFSRLLETDPNSKAARLGLLNIADRYAILAEQSLANNNYENVDAYISIGLKIDPSNETLLSLRTLNNEIRKRSIFDSFKSLFSK